MSNNLRSLIDKLSQDCRDALEQAASLCLSRTHHHVEVAHWLLKLIELDDAYFNKILEHYNIKVNQLVSDIDASIQQFKTGNDHAPALSQNLVEWIRESWSIASLEFSDTHVNIVHLFCALLKNDVLRTIAYGSSREFAKVPLEHLIAEVNQVIGSVTQSGDAAVNGQTNAASATQAAKAKKQTALQQFTINLTEEARRGHIDEAIGRDSEIRQIVDILTRRRQNNPILTGEPGVGKTAVVEGFALRIVQGNVPPSLKDVAVHTLDLGLLQAGAGIKGEFENRLKSVINEVKASPQPIIIFIDEAHTLVGAGAQAGQGDAANLLKPALARGELRTIAATTWAEYKKYFEKDAALTRRFQVVKVEEPDTDNAIAMMRASVATLEKHHQARILDEAVVESVKLSQRYIPSRFLPDKSASLLDTASARVSLQQTAIPAAIEDSQASLEQLKVSMNILKREQATSSKHDEKLAELQQKQTQLDERLAQLNQQWEQEKTLIQQIRDIHHQLESGEAATEKLTDEKVLLSPEQRSQLRDQLDELNKQLKQTQGEQPLMQPVVDAQAIAEVVADWTGIPVGRMVTDEIHAVLSLKDQLQQRIIAQPYALDVISQSIRTSRANLTDPRKPIGVFLLVGTSGVGKTETALSLAELLYGSEQNLTVINMSEYKEEHKIATLIGSPPGYVGYGEGGVLTEAVRRKPYSLLLLDEMEKAHPGVQDLFYQVFDKGMLRDSEGRDIDFKNTIIIMTANAGSDTIEELCADRQAMPDVETLEKNLRPDLLKIFKPAFLGRVKLVPYLPLDDEAMMKIAHLQLARIQQRVAEHYRAQFSYTDELVSNIIDRCHEVESGARNIDHIINRTLLPELATRFLSHMAEGDSIAKVHVSVEGDKGFTYQLN